MCDDRDDDFQIEAGECEACAVGQYLSDEQDQCVCEYNACGFFQNILEGISSYCVATYTPVLDFWWCLSWVSNPEWIPYP